MRMTPDLIAAEWRILFSLGACGSATKSPQGPIFDRLIERGYLERWNHYIRLTDAGRELIKKYIMSCE